MEIELVAEQCDEALAGDSFHFFFELNPQPMWLVDEKTLRFLDVNEAAARLYGYPRGLFREMCVLDVVDASTAQLFIRAWYDAARSVSDAVPREWCHHTSSGDTLTVKLLRSHVRWRGQDCVLIVCRNLTARKEVEGYLAVRYALTRLLSEARGAIPKVLRGLCTGLGFAAGELWLSIEERAGLERHSAWKDPSLEGSGHEAPSAAACLKAGLLARVCQSGSPTWTWLNDFAEGSPRSGSQRAAIQGAFLFPFRVDGMGGVVVLFSVCPEEPREAITELIADIAGQIGQHLARQYSEQRLRILSNAVEQSPVSIMITDLEGKIEYVNSRAADVTGYSVNELIGSKPSILKSGETPAEDYRQLWSTISSGGEWRGTFHNRKKNGELYWEDATIRVIRDDCGTPTHYLGLKQDITERRNLEAALRISEERFRIAATNSSDVVYDWDLVSDATEVVGGIRGQLGLAVQAHPKTSEEYRQLVHPDDRAQLIAAVNRHLQTGEPYSEEYRLILPNGEIRHVSDQGAAVRTTAGVPYKWMGVLRDITERRTAQLALVESEERLRLITETITEVFWMADAAINQIHYVSPAYECVWGRPCESLYRNPRSFLDALHPDDFDRTCRYLEVQFAAAQQLDHEYRVIHSDGTTHWIWNRGFPLPRKGGEPYQYVGIALDITDRKNLESQLARAQKLESIGELAAGIAHEINTPIQYIGDNGHFLQDAFQKLLKLAEPEVTENATADLNYLRSEVPTALEQLLEGVDRVAQIVRAMKEFSHPGSVTKTAVDINHAIESTILVSRNEWKYVAELSADLDRTLPPIPCVPCEFNQVILNLIVNAAHAVASVVRDTGSKGIIHITTRRNDDSVEIRVADTGCGIPKSLQSRIFDPFFTTKPVGKGTGQGLAIAHSVVVQKHGGSIDVESEPGQGATFVIQLPLENPSGK